MEGSSKKYEYTDWPEKSWEDQNIKSIEKAHFNQVGKTTVMVDWWLFWSAHQQSSLESDEFKKHITKLVVVCH